MTGPAVNVRAVVARERYITPSRTYYGPWLAHVWVEGPGANDRSHSAKRASHPEALQAAQVLRAELERELMDDVHASRAQRRTLNPDQIITTEEPA